MSMAAPVTKKAVLVNDVNDLPALLEEAFALAVSGRPGPVLLDIPMDVQRAEVEDVSRLTKRAVEVSGDKAPGTEVFLEQLASALASASRPAILAGGGLNSGRAIEEFRKLVDRLDLPVLNSLMAVER